MDAPTSATAAIWDSEDYPWGDNFMVDVANRRLHDNVILEQEQEQTKKRKLLKEKKNQ